MRQCIPKGIEPVGTDAAIRDHAPTNSRPRTHPQETLLSHGMKVTARQPPCTARHPAPQYGTAPSIPRLPRALPPALLPTVLNSTLSYMQKGRKLPAARTLTRGGDGEVKRLLNGRAVKDHQGHHALQPGPEVRLATREGRRASERGATGSSGQLCLKRLRLLIPLLRRTDCQTSPRRCMPNRANSKAGTAGAAGAADTTAGQHRPTIHMVKCM
jgi:hypothetical protein